MSLRAYMVIMTVATGLSGLAWLSIAANTDPGSSSRFGFFLFYASLFTSLLGFFSVAGFLIRFVAMRQALAFRLVKEAFRQAFLLSFFVLSCLWLLASGRFAWLNVFFLISALSLMEFLILSYRPKSN